MSQSDLYKYQSNIDYLGDFPGADVEKNRVLTTLKESTAKLDIESRVGRTLGTVGVNDTSDSQIDPATEGTLSTVADLADALASNGGDTLRTDATLDAETVAIEGDDDDGNTIEANIETLSQAVADPDGLVTYLARALQQYGDDQLRVDIENESVDMASETTLSSLDSGVGNLDDATQAQANDQLRVDIQNNNGGLATESSLTSEQAREIATWTAGTLAVEQQSPVAIEGDDDNGNTLNVGVERFSDAIADRPGLLTYLARALQTQGFDQLRVDIENESADLASETTLSSRLGRELQADAGGGTYAPIHRDGNALQTAIHKWAAGTLPVEQQSAVAVENTTGNQINPALKTRYLDAQRAGHDLVGSGDISIGPGAVERGTAVTIAATSLDDNAFSVSVEWVGAGNTYQSEAAADIGLDSITEDYARLVRKAPAVEITVTDESGAAQNNVNIHADTER
jgi:hypothetical protein